MTARTRLLRQLEDEIAQGFPPPTDGSHEPWDAVDPALTEYIGIVADVALAAETHPHTLQIRKAA